MNRIIKLTMVGLEPTAQAFKGWMAGSVPGHGDKVTCNFVPRRL